MRGSRASTVRLTSLSLLSLYLSTISQISLKWEARKEGKEEEEEEEEELELEEELEPGAGAGA
jgi:hypothetical protein